MIKLVKKILRIFGILKEKDISSIQINEEVMNNFNPKYPWDVIGNMSLNKDNNDNEEASENYSCYQRHIENMRKINEKTSILRYL